MMYKPLMVGSMPTKIICTIQTETRTSLTAADAIRQLRMIFVMSFLFLVACLLRISKRTFTLLIRVAEFPPSHDAYNFPLISTFQQNEKIMWLFNFWLWDWLVSLWADIGGGNRVHFQSMSCFILSASALDMELLVLEQDSSLWF